jgi:hypothetical protein
VRRRRDDPQMTQIAQMKKEEDFLSNLRDLRHLRINFLAFEQRGSAP